MAKTKEKEQEKSQSGSQKQSGSEDPQDQSSTDQGKTPGSESTPTSGGETKRDQGAQSPFKHKSLQGKTPEQVEREFLILKAANREQNETLNRLHEEVNRTPVQDPDSGRQGGETRRERPTKDDFWEDPVGVMDQTIKSHLEEVIEPFRRDLARSQKDQVYARAAQDPSMPHFSEREPLIRTLVNKYGIAEPNLETLRNLYYTAGGIIAENPEVAGELGIDQGQSPSGKQTRDDPPSAPPQHDPSSQPLPSGEGKKKKTRELTENEKRLAREWNMTDEEYLEAQEGSEITVGED